MERFEVGDAVLEVGGCVPTPAVPPRIRGRPGLLCGDASDAPRRVAPPREDFPRFARPSGDAVRRALARERLPPGRGPGGPLAFCWRRGDDVGGQPGRLSLAEGTARRVSVSSATPVEGAVRSPAA